MFPNMLAWLAYSFNADGIQRTKTDRNGDLALTFQLYTIISNHLCINLPSKVTKGWVSVIEYTCGSPRWCGRREWTLKTAFPRAKLRRLSGGDWLLLGLESHRQPIRDRAGRVIRDLEVGLRADTCLSCASPL